jgi:hypothetical protein
MPSRPMVMLEASRGMVMAGWTGKPLAVTSWPSRVGLEGAVAGVRGGAVGHQHLEEAAAVDGHVASAFGLGEVALRVDALGGDHVHAGADLQARRQAGLVRRLAAALAQVLIDQVFEHRAAALEAGGAHVGQVVGDHVELRLLRVEAGLGDVEGANHVWGILWMCCGLACVRVRRQGGRISRTTAACWPTAR